MPPATTRSSKRRKPERSKALHESAESLGTGPCCHNSCFVSPARGRGHREVLLSASRSGLESRCRSSNRWAEAGIAGGTVQSPFPAAGRYNEVQDRMRPVTLLSVALVGLLCAAAPAGAAPPGDGAPGQPQGPSQEKSQGQVQGAPHAAPPPHAAAPSPSQAAPAARPPGPGVRASERRRRISYAACNRESHRRRLSGGARRRFLVRCRLGYERRPASQPAPARRP